MRKIKLHTKRVIYIALGILAFSILYALKNTSYFVRIFGFILSVFVFFAADKFFSFGFKKHHYFIFILISTGGILFSPLYFIYPHYDKILHLIIPILFCILIFFLVDKLDTRLSVKLAITFAIMATMASMHEVGEYLLDQVFDWKLQGVYLRDYSGIAKLKIIQDKNDDTMIDMLLSTCGSLIFISYKTIEFHYKKLKGKLTKSNKR